MDNITEIEQAKKQIEGEIKHCKSVAYMKPALEKAVECMQAVISASECLGELSHSTRPMR